MKVKHKLFTAMFLTLFLAFAGIAALLNSYIYRSTGSDAEASLKAISVSFSGSCSVLDTGRFHEEGGRFYKGTREISSLSALAEELKNQTGADISLYIGTTCAVSTISNKTTGEHITGTVFTDKAILEKVLEKGDPVFSDSFSLFSKSYYAYFFPVSDDTGSPAGFVSAVLEKEAVLRPVSRMFSYFLIILGVLLLIAVIIMLCSLSGVSRSLTAINASMASLEFEDLSHETNKKISRRKDEFGDIYRSCENIRKNLDVLYNNVKQASLDAVRLSERVSSEASEAELNKIYSFFSDITEEIGSLAISAKIESACGRTKAGSPVADRLQELAELSADELGKLNVNLASIGMSSMIRSSASAQTVNSASGQGTNDASAQNINGTSVQAANGVSAQNVSGASGQGTKVASAQEKRPVVLPVWPSKSSTVRKKASDSQVTDDRASKESIEEALIALSGRLESTVFGFKK